VLEAASYGMITLLGFYLLWQALSMFLPRKAHIKHPELHGGPTHSHHEHHSHTHVHEENCGHNHMPSARDVSKDWSLTKALSISLAVGIRPCTGAILALLFANAIGVYWAGVASTFVMAIGTAFTVSAIAILAVLSKRTAMRIIDKNQTWLNWSAFLLRLAGGVVIASLGASLFLASVHGYATAG
jgi:nickel/cobalt transporter (NicO) family protein